jgi:DNA-binding MarR family transcriptional regulator
MNNPLRLADYESFGVALSNLYFSEQASHQARLEPRQHQLALTLKGLPKGKRLRIGELAKRPQIQHHSAVELANRLASGGYVRRHHGAEDRREVLLFLTAEGENILRGAVATSQGRATHARSCAGRGPEARHARRQRLERDRDLGFVKRQENKQ